MTFVVQKKPIFSVIVVNKGWERSYSRTVHPPPGYARVSGIVTARRVAETPATGRLEERLVNVERHRILPLAVSEETLLAAIFIHDVDLAILLESVVVERGLIAEAMI